MSRRLIRQGLLDALLVWLRGRRRCGPGLSCGGEPLVMRLDQGCLLTMWRPARPVTAGPWSWAGAKAAAGPNPAAGARTPPTRAGDGLAISAGSRGPWS
mmetsp:Transcript_145362/g.352939  ORF Transcript_145362/g.352939 Transcript_145362/m.352939 type:complete len:99 (-) Transcript_145362:83-379(-)